MACTERCPHRMCSEVILRHQCLLLMRACESAWKMWCREGTMKILHLTPPHSLPTPARLRDGAVRTTAAHPKPIAHRPCRSEKQNAVPLVHLDRHDIAYTRPMHPFLVRAGTCVRVCFLHTLFRPVRPARAPVVVSAHSHKPLCVAATVVFLCVGVTCALDCNLAAYHRVRVIVVERHVTDAVVEHTGCLVESQGGVLAWGAS